MEESKLQTKESKLQTSLQFREYCLKSSHLEYPDWAEGCKKLLSEPFPSRGESLLVSIARALDPRPTLAIILPSLHQLFWNGLSFALVGCVVTTLLVIVLARRSKAKRPGVQHELLNLEADAGETDSTDTWSTISTNSSDETLVGSDSGVDEAYAVDTDTGPLDAPRQNADARLLQQSRPSASTQRARRSENVLLDSERSRTESMPSASTRAAIGSVHMLSGSAPKTDSANTLTTPSTNSNAFISAVSGIVMSSVSGGLVRLSSLVKTRDQATLQSSEVAVSEQYASKNTVQRPSISSNQIPSRTENPPPTPASFPEPTRRDALQSKTSIKPGANGSTNRTIQQTAGSARRDSEITEASSQPPLSKAQPQPDRGENPSSTSDSAPSRRPAPEPSTQGNTISEGWTKTIPVKRQNTGSTSSKSHSSTSQSTSTGTASFIVGGAMTAVAISAASRTRPQNPVPSHSPKPDNTRRDCTRQARGSRRSASPAQPKPTSTSYSPGQDYAFNSTSYSNSSLSNRGYSYSPSTQTSDSPSLLSSANPYSPSNIFMPQEWDCCLCRSHNEAIYQECPSCCYQKCKGCTFYPPKKTQSTRASTRRR
ncbi:hypothetical protein B0I35DRAFT_439874 [Stachybotrys elegans]|uniref:RanBP2-type domain-containing protein n=1 Tax=Stachybotrys elegans TaxID=80388 RepID=A0A8K0WPF5_9HYPO|nr:hypothetical protein B0I35DRAFT_439874 [Stachybotrys elegans]